MKENDFIFEENLVVTFIEDMSKKQDAFLKQQLIDHIMHNGKKYRVVNICASKVKEIVDKGLKYDQLYKQTQQLKSEQNKVAVEKLEEVKEFVRVYKNYPNYNCEELLQDITNLIKELNIF